MSSEEMRFELEAFVNTGLEEGWCGWPLKEQSRKSRTSRVLHAGPIKLWRRQGSATAALCGRLQAFKARGRYFGEN